MGDIVIAIDGYSGTGKSSTAKAVAKELGYLYLDSGAMYRAVTYYFLEKAANLNDQQEVENLLSELNIEMKPNHILANGMDVTDEIRSMRVNQHVSKVSAIPAVRAVLVAQQRRIGMDKGVVMDGRDIGTVVFPKAELKVFMTADTVVRAKRRQQELAEKGIFEELNTIEDNLKERDKMDTSRETSPLKQAIDAMVIDTSDLTFDEQVHKIVKLANEEIGK